MSNVAVGLHREPLLTRIQSQLWETAKTLRIDIRNPQKAVENFVIFTEALHVSIPYDGQELEAMRSVIRVGLDLLHQMERSGNREASEDVRSYLQDQARDEMVAALASRARTPTSVTLEVFVEVFGFYPYPISLREEVEEMTLVEWIVISNSTVLVTSHERQRSYPATVATPFVEQFNQVIQLLTFSPPKERLTNTSRAVDILTRMCGRLVRFNSLLRETTHEINTSGRHCLLMHGTLVRWAGKLGIATRASLDALPGDRREKKRLRETVDSAIELTGLVSVELVDIFRKHCPGDRQCDITMAGTLVQLFREVDPLQLENWVLKYPQQSKAIMESAIVAAFAVPYAARFALRFRDLLKELRISHVGVNDISPIQEEKERRGGEIVLRALKELSG
ncbi:hypothetical protein T439DRAFT_327567 [Meredithblackwellia eburnea MCA 4105]